MGGQLGKGNGNYSHGMAGENGEFFPPLKNHGRRKLYED